MTSFFVVKFRSNFGFRHKTWVLEIKPLIFFPSCKTKRNRNSNTILYDKPTSMANKPLKNKFLLKYIISIYFHLLPGFCLKLVKFVAIFSVVNFVSLPAQHQRDLRLDLECRAYTGWGFIEHGKILHNNPDKVNIGMVHFLKAFTVPWRCSRKKEKG